ncbi:DUF87 domain-containing protein [Xanthobacter sp. V2C-8]|uniref:helicase HerA domain-containing protein n=1 Tax=Xanthobacter albus TaxID=3119929 RepID=UPI003728A775
MPLTSAFLDARNDDLFTTIANFTNARELSELNVNEHQGDARSAIFDAVVHALKLNPSPGARIALIKGDAGSGKSHVLTTTLRDFASITEHRAYSVYPAILQLTAPVTISTYDVWLLDAVIRELSARHFGDEAGLSPLRRLADKLLQAYVEEPAQAAFQEEIEDLESDGEIEIALKIGQNIAREARAWSAEGLDPSLVGAILLAGFNDPSALNYLRHGHADSRLTPLRLPPIATASQRIDAIRSLSRLAQLVHGSLVLGFDQVENTTRLGDEGLFVHALTQAVRLVESIPNCAVVVAVVSDEYDEIADGRRGGRALTNSDRDRIEREAPFPAVLNAGAPDFRREVVARRLSLLRTRAHLPAAPGSLEPLPSWLMPAIEANQSIRAALRRVSEFRTDAMKRGRLPSEQEFFGTIVPPKPAAQEIDFAKLWEDFKDQGATTTRRLLDTKKAELLAWWAHEASREHVTADPAEVRVTHLSDDLRTPVIDIQLKQGGQVIERRELALCEAPNRNQKLADQIIRFLEASDGAVPFALRTNGFAKSPTSQVAPALRKLRAIGGDVLYLNDTEWDTLARAHDFLARWQHETGLITWRRDAQWLRRLVAPLLPLIALPDVIAREGDHEQTLPPEKGEGTSPADKNEPPPATGTTGASFPVLIGATEAKEPVYWAPYAPPPGHLNNFSVLVTGDAGSGKTQTIRVLIDAACRNDLAVTIFDFKADYCEPDFAGPLGLKVVDVRAQGLPFNPLEPPPRGASGAQPIEHAYEIAGILARVFRLGAVQEARLRDAICAAYRECGVDPQEWVQPDTIAWPSFNRVVDLLAEAGDNAALVSRLGALKDFRLFGTGGPSPNRAAEFFQGRVCLKLSTLPGDDIKTAIAEILIVQLHGHLLRGAQPRRLTRLLVFDEAHRVKDSRRLEQLAREGRAFGVGIVIGTQFPGDMPSDMAGNLATQLFLMNNQAQHRRAIALQVCGTVSSPKAKALLDRLGRMRPLQGLFSNPHYGAVFVDVVPHYQRTTEPAAS